MRVGEAQRAERKGIRERVRTDEETGNNAKGVDLVSLTVFVLASHVL